MRKTIILFIIFICFLTITSELSIIDNPLKNKKNLEIEVYGLPCPSVDCWPY